MRSLHMLARRISFSSLLLAMLIGFTVGARADDLSDAERGDVSAMIRVARRYEQGDGVGRDFVKAKFWYEKAVDRGSGLAAYVLGRRYENGEMGLVANPRVAKIWYEIGAQYNDADAANAIGVLYYQGKGIDADKSEARRWYQKAISLGSDQAVKNLKELDAEQAKIRREQTENLANDRNRRFHACLESCTRTFDIRMKSCRSAPSWGNVDRRPCIDNAVEKNNQCVDAC